MALAKATLETKLKSVFASMRDGSKTNAWMASQIAAEIRVYILAGQVSTTDSGTAPAGVYAGAGSGTVTINNDNLGSALKTTFEAAYGNDDLAAHIAADINAACSASDTVSTSTKGTVTTSSGSSSSFSGTGKGKFTGAKATIETTLKACFAAMNALSKGGDDYFAAQLAAAVDAYLKAGSVNVTLQSPLAGSGTGAVA
ncbi:MAG: hypothetical protein LBL20_00145 [Treponema sp.]|jgi:hypothetical protein|nr:hypothetical protein [Treponema sp.]